MAVPIRELDTAGRAPIGDAFKRLSPCAASFGTTASPRSTRRTIRLSTTVRRSSVCTGQSQAQRALWLWLGYGALQAGRRTSGRADTLEDAKAAWLEA